MTGLAAANARGGARRRAVAVAVVAGVAALHILRIGSYLRGTAYRLYYSYASDVLLPFAMYFVLCLNERHVAVLGDWRAKALVILAAASGAEVLQGLGVPVLGRTFDPLDFVMYGIGVSAALAVERVLCPPRLGRADGLA
jgi:hypothetical protein